MENAGFEAWIAVGETPWDESSYHAWVIVYTSDNYRTVIESTALVGGMQGLLEQVIATFSGENRGIIYYDASDPVAVNYYEGYDKLYSSIFDEDIVNNLSEWNWWRGAWGLD